MSQTRNSENFERKKTHLDGHALPELVRDLTVAGLPLSEELIVVLGVAKDGNTVVVLSGGTEKGDTSDVDLLDGLSDGGRGNAGDSLVEGVEVADNDVDGGNALGLEVLLVGGDVAGEDTCESGVGMSCSRRSEGRK
jgi:hypothetical protein